MKKCNSHEILHFLMLHNSLCTTCSQLSVNYYGYLYHSLETCVRKQKKCKMWLPYSKASILLNCVLWLCLLCLWGIPLKYTFKTVLNDGVIIEQSTQLNLKLPYILTYANREYICQLSKISRLIHKLLYTVIIDWINCLK